MKKCPECAELVQDDALICPHCRQTLKTNWPIVVIGLAVALLVVVFFGGR